jgi:hypothetical protein
VAQSRLSLLFNAVAKIPMQAFILFIGAMVFVFYVFERPPVLFQQTELQRIQTAAGYEPVNAEYNRAFESRRTAALALVEAHKAGDKGGEARRIAEYRAAQKAVDSARQDAAQLVVRTGGEKGFTDANYIFLSFVTRYMPAGIVGLLIAVIFAATMSASSGEINSLAAVTVMDIYRRYIRRDATDHHYLQASRLATLFWGIYAVAFAGFAGGLGPLIVAVNKVGSLFYGSLLGCFVLALGFRRVRGTAAFCGMLAGEAAILATAKWTDISWLWYNVIGCGVVVAAGLALTWIAPRPGPHTAPLYGPGMPGPRADSTLLRPLTVDFHGGHVAALAEGHLQLQIVAADRARVTQLAKLHVDDEGNLVAIDFAFLDLHVSVRPTLQRARQLGAIGFEDERVIEGPTGSLDGPFPGSGNIGGESHHRQNRQQEHQSAHFGIPRVSIDHSIMTPKRRRR